MTATIPTKYTDLLDEPVVVQLATVMADGQPQVTPVWASREGDEVWINTAKGRTKDRNLRARPLATVAITDPKNPYRYLEIRGEVADIVEGEAADEHINALSQAYFGRPFGSYAPGEERVIFKIRPKKVNASG